MGIPHAWIMLRSLLWYGVVSVIGAVFVARNRGCLWCSQVPTELAMSGFAQSLGEGENSRLEQHFYFKNVGCCIYAVAGPTMSKMGVLQITTIGVLLG